MSVKTNARAIEGLALETWRMLTTAQQTALRRAMEYSSMAGGVRLRSSDLHARTYAAMIAHALVVDGGWLTPLGLLVRDAGAAETERQAKRRYAARLRGQA